MGEAATEDLVTVPRARVGGSFAGTRRGSDVRALRGSFSSALDEVRRSDHQNPADPSAEVSAEVPEVSGDEMRRFRRDRRSHNRMVFIR